MSSYKAITAKNLVSINQEETKTNNIFGYQIRVPNGNFWATRITTKFAI